jgi:glycosyltransferase involved in cell wall biosynthesis
MKILFISRGYPTSQDPQWGCFEKDQALALQKMGHEIIFLSIDRRFRIGNKKWGCTYRNENGFHIYNYKSFIPGTIVQRISSSLYNRYFSTILLTLYKKAIQKHGTPDILFAHYLSNIALSIKIKEKYNIPLIGMEHWSQVNKDSLSPKVYSTGIIGYNSVNKLLVVSNALKDRIKRHFNIDSDVVYNTIGTEFENKNRNNSKKKNFQFISIGSLFPGKGYDVLIKAFAKSELASKGCKLLIIGQGGEENKLKNLITDYQLIDNIILLGRKTKNEIAEYLKESHAFVLASRGETFGVVFIEAMMFGLPVISTKCGGPEEIINSDNGLLVEKDNVNELSDALIHMYNNVGDYNSELIARQCYERYSPSQFAKKINKIFEEVLLLNKK